VALIGRLDRIDAGADGRARVIDYKARRADLLKTALRAPGEDVQLPLYGLLCAESEEAAYLSLARARDGDPGVREIAPPGDFVALRDRVGERLRRDLTRIAAGAPLDAIGIDAVCAYCEMRGLCRRGYWPRPLPGTDQ
jgi:ATP-dependent helicase/nuclease subunit B